MLWQILSQIGKVEVFEVTLLARSHGCQVVMLEFQPRNLAIGTMLQNTVTVRVRTLIVAEF